MEIKAEPIPVKEIIDDLGERFQFELVSGQSGLDRLIYEKDLNRPALAITGYFGNFRFDRIQILGNTENGYLRNLTSEARYHSIEEVFRYPIPLIILTDKNVPSPEMIELSNRYHVPLVTTPLSTTELISQLGTSLDERFAPKIQVHGVLVDVYGVGILIYGKARSGKSELALDLIERGHRLVADDVVDLSKRMTGILMGRAPELLRHVIEVRGLGILNVEHLFGVRAVRLQKRVEVVLELITDASEEDIERIGLETKEIELLGVKLPYIQLPVVPGKYLAVLAEIVALNYLLRLLGINSAKEFTENLQREIERKRQIRKHIEGDFE
ncbi:MAG: HPr(Ser) kinase/phosphatase [bacterium]|nr:HPr(Ser) kinase/phosphatase [bacterium]